MFVDIFKFSSLRGVVVVLLLVGWFPKPRSFLVIFELVLVNHLSRALPM